MHVENRGVRLVRQSSIQDSGSYSVDHAFLACEHCTQGENIADHIAACMPDIDSDIDIDIALHAGGGPT